MPKTVLITGVTGFTGRFLAERYVSLGWEVHGVHRARTADYPPAPSGMHSHRVDLMDASSVYALLASIRPDVIQHLAAQSSVSVSMSDPAGTLWVNTTMQRNLLDSLILTRQNPCVVIAGSGDVYGNAAPELNPIHELVELRPANPYALSKAIQDLMGYQYWASHQLRIIRVRPFLQLGPRRDDRFVAGHFARQIAEIEADLREPIIRVGSIDLRRDFTDVRDVASAYIHAADHGVPGEAYNIASGVAHSLRDMLLIMLEHTRKPAEICTDPELVRPGEPALLIGDASKLRHLAGWAPTISFEQSVLDTVTYWENQVARDPVPSKGQS